MKKFLCRFALFMLPFFATALIALLFCAPQFTHNYMASSLDKIARLESIKSPKIILVGNSNVAFGFRSDIIEKELGMGCVNLGLHGGMNNRFHEDMAKYNIQKGDIVAVCHTSYFDDGKIGDHRLAWITIENHFRLWPLIRHDAVDTAASFPWYMATAVQRWLTGADKYSDSCYSREAFNAYGDNTYPRERGEYVFQREQGVSPAINDTCIKRLNAFNRYCARRGATLVVAGYPIGDGEYTPDKAQFVARWNELKSRLDCAVVSNIEDYFFPYSDFYNTNLHLTDSAAIKRTWQFIKDIRQSGLLK